MHTLGLGKELYLDFSGNSEAPLGTNEHAKQVVPTRLSAKSAEFYDLPVVGHHGECGDVPGRDPVFEAMRPSRILGNVASEGTGAL